MCVCYRSPFAPQPQPIWVGSPRLRPQSAACPHPPNMPVWPSPILIALEPILSIKSTRSRLCGATIAAAGSASGQSVPQPPGDHGPEFGHIAGDRGKRLPGAVSREGAAGAGAQGGRPASQPPSSLVLLVPLQQWPSLQVTDPGPPAQVAYTFWSNSVDGLQGAQGFKVGRGGRSAARG